MPPPVIVPRWRYRHSLVMSSEGKAAIKVEIEPLSEQTLGEAKRVIRYALPKDVEATTRDLDASLRKASYYVGARLLDG